MSLANSPRFAETVQAVTQRGQAELRERLVNAGRVKMAVEEMRAGAGARHALDRDTEEARQRYGDVVERGGDAGRGVERAAAAVPQDESGERRHVVDRNVVTLLLAVAEDADRPPRRGLAAE